MKPEEMQKRISDTVADMRKQGVPGIVIALVDTGNGTKGMGFGSSLPDKFDGTPLAPIAMILRGSGLMNQDQRLQLHELANAVAIQVMIDEITPGCDCIHCQAINALKDKLEDERQNSA